MIKWRSAIYLELQNLLRAYFAAPYQNDGFIYQPNWLCSWQGVWYRCINTTSGVFNAADWQAIPSPAATSHGNFNPTRVYNIGDYAIYLGGLYQCSTNNTTGIFNSSNWTFIDEFRHLNWIDVFNAQYFYWETENTEIQNALPAIYIQFHEIDWRKAGNLLHGNCTVRLHVVLESYHQTYFKSYDQKDGLDRLDYLQRVNDAFDGYVGSFFTALKRTGETMDADHNNVIVHLLDYETNITLEAETKQVERRIIESVHINPDYDNAVGNFDRLADKTKTAINNNPTTPPTDNGYYIP